MRATLRYIRDNVLDKIFYRNENRFLIAAYNHMRLASNRPAFVSILDYVLLCEDWVKMLPKDIDIVVAIPRQGLFPAQIASNYLGRALSIPELALKGDYWLSPASEIKPSFKKILLVDDCSTGTRLEKWRRVFSKQYPNASILTAAPLFNDNYKRKVDYYAHRSGSPKFLEMSLMHNYIDELGTDLDGVLVHGDKALRVPSVKIKLIATSRPESEREATENWLRKNNVRYSELVMRKEGYGAVETKVNAILKHKVKWFWESEREEAIMIHLLSGVPVLCFENMYLYGGSEFRHFPLSK